MGKVIESVICMFVYICMYVYGHGYRNKIRKNFETEKRKQKRKDIRKYGYLKKMFL